MASENHPLTKNKRRQRQFTADCDLCDQVVDCYSKSIAPHHVNLCAIAKATRSIIDSEPRTPIAYYDTIINSLSSASKTHDDVQGLSLLLQIVLPLLPKKAITASKAADAAEIVVEALKVSRGSALVECLGLLLGRCAVGKWVVSLELGIKTLIECSMDRRQKVRECAQQCVVNVFNSIEEKTVKRNASEFLIDSFTSSMSLALNDGPQSASDQVSHSSIHSVLHLLDMLRILIPCLRPMYAIKAIEALQKPMTSAKSPMVMRRAIDFMELTLNYCEIEPGPIEITISIGKDWISFYSSVMHRIADLLRSDEVTTATRASTILKAKIKRVCSFVCLYKDEPSYGALEKMVTSLWLKLEEILNTHTNEYSLSVMAVLYDKFGFCPAIYKERIFLKVAKSMVNASGDIKKHVQECIGSAVTMMGPSKVLELLPISVTSNNNTWLITIFRDYVIRSKLGFFIERIVPLVESFQIESQKEESRVIREELDRHAHGCWGLLPAFCRHPTDMHENFGPLVKLLISYIEKSDPFVLESICIAMEHLVKRNKNMSFVSDDKASKLWKIRYDKETAIENIKTMSLWSEELLNAFIQRFFREKPPPAFLKETIRCLALVTDSQKVNEILLEIVSIDEPSNEHDLIHVLSSCVLPSRVIGTNRLDPDRDDIIYHFIKTSLQDGVEEVKAFATLNKILVGSSKFMSTKFEQVLILLFGLDPVVDATSLKLLFSCYKTLFLHSMEIYCNAKNDYGTHILYRIIVEPNNDESRELAHGILKETSSMLQSRESSSLKPGNHYVFINMIMWFLFKTPPYMSSVAVNALTSLITHDSKILYSVPDLMPSVLELLDTDDNIPVIKAVLGFISSLEKRDMHHFQDDILAALRPWSSVSHPSTNLKWTALPFSLYLIFVIEERHGFNKCKNEEEVVAVIAHELGHWKLNHTMYSFIAVQFHRC